MNYCIKNIYFIKLYSKIIMYNNRYVNALINFIKEHKTDYKKLLLKAPYNLKTVKSCTWHPNWYIFMYNLSQSSLKNEIVRACRGIVLYIDEQEVKPVSVPYTKFFNYNEEDGKDIYDLIDWSKAKITLKIDGMLIKTACIEENGEKRLYFFTNGSFDLNTPFSDSFIFDEVETRGLKYYGDLLSYALKKVDDGINIFFDKEIGSFYITGGWADKIPLNSTLLFELVSPRNKIICHYKETKLYLHGYRDPDLIEHDPRELDFNLKFDFPDSFDASNYEDVVKIISNFNGLEKEGCVVVDYSHPETPRAKIKCESYLKEKFSQDTLANNQIIFKSVVFDESDDLVSNVPATVPKVEEFKIKLQKFKEYFLSECSKTKDICKSNNQAENKKAWALWCKGKGNISKVLMPFYMLMTDSNPEVKFEQKIKALATQKHCFEIFNKILEQAKI